MSADDYSPLCVMLRHRLFVDGLTSDTALGVWELFAADTLDDVPIERGHGRSERVTAVGSMPVTESLVGISGGR